MATDKKRPEVDQLVESPARGGRARAATTRGTRAEALEIIFETAIRDKEGFRHGVLGKPRVGKTYHLQDVVEGARDLSIAELTLIHDCKRLDVQYDGLVRADRNDLALHPLAPDDDPRVVFHGRPELNIKCSVDSVALLALEQGRQGTSVHLLVDELYHALQSRQTWLGPESGEGTSAMGEVLREGSSQRVSSSWTTQFPAALPTECLDMTETIAIFRLSGRSLRYIAKMLELSPAAVEAIRRLGRGEFILATDDDWNGVIYGPT